MTDDHFAALRSPQAWALVEYLTRSVEPTYATLDAVVADEGHDVIDLTVEPQLVQRRAVAIANVEPVRLRFPIDGSAPPSVRSRRDDFPLGLVHTNLEPDRHGLALCVWEEGWADLGRGLTPQALVERIRTWFSRSAEDKLHQPDQALEPLIPASANTLVLPPGPPSTDWVSVKVEQLHDRWTLLVEPIGAAAGAQRIFPMLAVEAEPQVHRALTVAPATLAQLGDLVAPMGVDLPQRLGDWLVQPLQLIDRERPMVLIVIVPMQRDKDGALEAPQIWAFLFQVGVGRIGEVLGRTLPDHKGGSVPSIGQPRQDLAALTLVPLRVVQRLDRATARTFAANPATSDRSLVAIGGGAIGSNVVVNTARAGIGRWTVIDDDVVLPHNVVRQAHPDAMVGMGKADGVADIADAILAEGGHAAIAADFLSPGDAADTVSAAIAQAELTIDFSASPAVLGHLADRKGVRRAASAFFSPDGQDLVVLAEDDRRAIKLDEIEAQYLIAVATEPLLDGHLDAARVDFVRYANACQDLSRPLPPWKVQTLSGIASGALIELEDAALARIWRLGPSGEVSALGVAAAVPYRLGFGGWRATISPQAAAAMRRYRAAAAPNETGGILIGSFDLTRRIVHVVAALPAPPDSRQSPTYFIRGAQALAPLVADIAARTANLLTYVGEWHSHPDGAAARPSGDDENVFAYLEHHIGPTGAPYLMAICGREEIWARGGWQGVGRGEDAFVPVDDPAPPKRALGAKRRRSRPPE